MERLLRGISKLDEASVIMKTRKTILVHLGKAAEEQFRCNENNILQLPVI